MQKLPEYFAGQALAGLAEQVPLAGLETIQPHNIAQLAWIISDEMMAERRNRQEQLKAWIESTHNMEDQTDG